MKKKNSFLLQNILWRQKNPHLNWNLHTHDFCLVVGPESSLWKLALKIIFPFHCFMHILKLLLTSRRCFENISDLTRQNLKGICGENCTICKKNKTIWFINLLELNFDNSGISSFSKIMDKPSLLCGKLSMYRHRCALSFY